MVDFLHSRTMEREKKTVVVGVDGSPDSLAALDWAATYAERFGLKLKLVVTWHVPSPITAAVLAADLEGAADDIAQQAVKRAQDAHQALGITHDVVSGTPGKVLVATSGDAALLVVGTSRMLGSVSSYCSHYATCSVVIVRETQEPPAVE